MDDISFTCNKEKLVPFLKWAGGKRWLVQNHAALLPSKFNSYLEPFLGSGVMFFHLSPKRGIISDKNYELIEAYCAIRDDWRKVFAKLKEHHGNHSKDYYYKVRASKPMTIHTRCARLIYLNRTCFNGIYRVNLSGQFNVPIGTKSKVVLDTDNFEGVASLLKRIELYSSDFEKVIDQAQEGDFVFADPPYTIKHNKNNFVKYNEVIFKWRDQVRLRDSLLRASQRGAKVMATNALHPSVEELYKQADFNLTPLMRKSVIASSPEKRGLYEEMIIRNWK